MIEWCGRALADVNHEMAVAEFGWGSPEEQATFHEQERNLALQLPFMRTSESMGNHDSEIVDAGSVD